MTRGDRLPCAVSVEQLLVQVADGTPPLDGRHQSACPHCRATLAEIRALWAPIGQLAADHVKAPPGLSASVMAKVHELPRNAWHAVLPGDRGTTYIAARVVSAVTKLAAEGLPAVPVAVGRDQQSPGWKRPYPQREPKSAWPAPTSSSTCTSSSASASTSPPRPRSCAAESATSSSGCSDFGRARSTSPSSTWKHPRPVGEDRPAPHAGDGTNDRSPNVFRQDDWNRGVVAAIATGRYQLNASA